MAAAGGIDQIAVLHLRYFLAVVEHGTVRAAAWRIGISQPSLSQQLAALERRLGIRLFDRSAVGMRPTEAGRRLAELAAQTMHGLRLLASPAASVRRIGIPRGVDAEVRGVLTARFGPSVEFVALDSARAVYAVGRDVDAAVLRGPAPAPTSGVVVSELRAAPIGVLLGVDHPLAHRERIEWRELAGQTLLWFDERRAPGYATWLLAACRAHGWQPGLRNVDPAGAGLFDDALRRGSDLVALRPRPSVLPAGVSWLPLADPPRERLLLATSITAAGPERILTTPR